MKIRRWIATGGKLALSGGLIAFLLAHISVKEILSALTQAQPALVAAGMLMIPLFTYLRACLMSLIAAKQGLALSASRIMMVNFSTAFYALFLPGVIAGGGIRWYLLSQDSKRYSEVLAAIVFNRLFTTMTMLMIGIVFFFLDRSSVSNGYVGTAMIASLIFLCLVYLVLFRSHLALWIQGRLENTAAIPRYIATPVAKLLDATIRFKDVSNRDLAVFTMVSLGHHLFGVMSTYLLCRSLSLPVGIVTICWIRAFIFFVLLMPVSIAGLGVREGSLVLVLQAYGVSPTGAMGFSFLLLARDVIGGLVGGVIEIYRFFRKPQAEDHINAKKTVDSL